MNADVGCSIQYIVRVYTIIHSIHSICVDNFYTIWIFLSCACARTYVRHCTFLTPTTATTTTSVERDIEWKKSRANSLILSKMAYALAIEASSKCLTDSNSFIEWRNNEARLCHAKKKLFFLNAKKRNVFVIA